MSAQEGRSGHAAGIVGGPSLTPSPHEAGETSRCSSVLPLRSISRWGRRGLGSAGWADRAGS